MTSKIIAWSSKACPLPGETKCGDDCAIVMSGRRAVLAVVDGIGHGAEAAFAAQRALAEIRSYTEGEPLDSMIRRCHARLRDTRGAALSLALIEADAATLSWIGIGNVEGIVLRTTTPVPRKPETLLLRAGVIGMQLPSLIASRTTLAPGDVVIFVTDGIARTFADNLTAKDEPQRLCDKIMSRSNKQNDDALVLAARYLG